MFPFKEQTIKETGLKHRTYWDAQRANRKLQDINREEIERARREDVEKAQAQGIEVEGDRLPVMVTMPDGSVAVDPHRAKIHHSGALVRDRVNMRWRQFCSTPQNDDDAEYPVPDFQPKEPRKLGMKAASAMSVRPDTEKRRPGRPRKQEMSL